ncbi:glycosyltransferase family 39 protein, partial [Nitrobacter sp. 62-13]|uniref:glycosyltransferase family 39 protein n=1 Tax=Nitrobacter sp. 62-13 TaxID=1895797 RepID=UPI0025FD2A5F
MTIAELDKSALQPERPALSSLLWIAALIAAMTAMRCIFAGTLDLRTDEAYYWTWSKESTLSFLDHPPMIAWFIRFGTAIFGDTDFGVRFAGLLAMPIS